MYKKAMKYFINYPMYNATVHLLIGLGIGVLITYPFIVNPLRVGGALVLLGILGHLYPLFGKK